MEGGVLVVVIVVVVVLVILDFGVLGLEINFRRDLFSEREFKECFGIYFLRRFIFSEWRVLIFCVAMHKRSLVTVRRKKNGMRLL